MSPPPPLATSIGDALRGAANHIEVALGAELRVAVKRGAEYGVRCIVGIPPAAARF